MASSAVPVGRLATPRVFDVTGKYGAKGDVRMGYGTIGAASSAVTGGTNANANQNITFTSADVGKWVLIYGAGATSSAALAATITAVNEGTNTATLSAPSGVAATNAFMYVGSDDTVAFQNAMMDATLVGGIVYAPAGMYFANVKQYPSTMIVGQGKSTVIMTRPDGPAAVIGTSAADGVEPYDMGLFDLTVHGLWIPGVGGGGPSARLIDYESVNGDAYSTPIANWPWISGDHRSVPVNDRVPMLSHIRAQASGADYAIYLGKNMRSAEVSDCYFYRGAGWGMRVDCTDAHFSNMDCGGFVDGIWISGQLNTFRNAKAWYALGGASKGANAQGGCGWYITGTGNDVSSCQSQDNVTDGLIIENTSGIKFDAFTSSGDGGSAVRLRSIAGGACTYNSGGVLITPNGDRQAPGSILTIDGNLVQHNKVYAEAAIGTIQGLPGLASGSAKTVLVNGGSYSTNDIKVGRERAVAASVTLTAGAPSYTPDPQYGGLFVITLQANGTITNTPGDGGAPPGSRMCFLIAQDATGGRTLTWGSNFHGMPAINLAPNAVTVVVVENFGGTGASWWPTTAPPAGFTPTATAAPANPAPGQVYYNTNTTPPVLQIWTGVEWNPIPVGPDWYKRNEAALSNFRQALANAVNSPCDIYMFGDSISEGFYASDWQNGWVHRLRRKLQALYNGAAIPGGAGMLVPHTVGMGGATDPWTMTGTASGVAAGSVTNGWGLANRYIMLNAVNDSATLTFTGTQVVVYFTGGAGTGSANVSIDGGAAVVVNTNAASTGSGKAWVSPALTQGTHTVTITRTGSLIVIDGALVVDGDLSAGVRVWDATHAGFTAGNEAGLSHYQDYLAQTGIAPDLAMICFGANDINTGVTSAQFGTDLTTLVGKIRSSSATTSMMIVMLPRRGSVTDAAWQPYVDVAEQVALFQGIAFVDLSKTVPPPASATPFGALWYDGVHPNDFGHLAIYDGVARALGLGGGVDPVEPVKRFILATAVVTAQNGQVIFSSGSGVTTPTVALGATFKVKNTSTTNAVTVTAASGQIESAASISVPPGNAVEVFCDGTNWWVT